LPGVPLGNADLIAMNGFVDTGDGGIRVSGNLNVAAIAVLNAGNIQVGGKESGVPPGGAQYRCAQRSVQRRGRGRQDGGAADQLG
jgi:hypothetical protein